MNSPARPRLRREVNVIPQAGKLQLRLGDESIVLLEGAPAALVTDVLDALDGSRTEEELVAHFGAERATLVESLLAELRRERLLEGETRGVESIPLDRCSRPVRDEPTRRVDITGHEPLVSLLADALSDEVELRVTHERDEFEAVSGETSLLLCAIERPDLELLERCNALAVDRAVPALFLNLSHGRHATVGPFFVPNDGACYRCWHQRLLENTAAHEEQIAYDEAQRVEGKHLKGFQIPQGARFFVAGLASLEVRAFFTPHRPVQTVNGALTVDLVALQCWREPCWRIPWCEVCGGRG